MLPVAETDWLWQTQTFSDRKKAFLWQTHTVCDRYIFSLTDKDFCDRQILFVKDIGCLWQKKTVFDRHRLSVTNTYWLWQTKTVSDRQILSVTGTYYLWQTQTVCDIHRLCVTDTDCLLQTQTVYGRSLLSVLRHTNFTTDILNITQCLSISQ